MTLPNCYRCGCQPCTCRDGITLYHGDCRPVLPLVPCDFILTDPPWLTNTKTMKHPDGVAKSTSRTISYGAVGKFDADIIAMCEDHARYDSLFLIGYKDLKPTLNTVKHLRCVFGWHKPGKPPAVTYPAPMDLSFIVWCGEKSKLIGSRNHWPSMVFSFAVPRAGCIGDRDRERILNNHDKKAAHPCQGPVRLYRRLVEPLDGLILDPYAGSGTTGRACKDLGRRCIMVEIEERYCEIAARRLEQEVLFT